MPTIKKLKVLSATGNPVYITDLEDMSAMLNAVGSFNTPQQFTEAGDPYPRIMSGFDPIDDATLSGGYLWYKGQIYGCEEATVELGRYLCVGSREVSDRSGQDGREYNAYTEYFASANVNPTPPTGQTLVVPEPLTHEIIESLKRIPLSIGNVRGENIADGAITPEHLAFNYRPEYTLFWSSITANFSSMSVSQIGQYPHNVFSSLSASVSDDSGIVYLSFGNLVNMPYKGESVQVSLRAASDGDGNPIFGFLRATLSRVGSGWAIRVYFKPSDPSIPISGCEITFNILFCSVS